MPNAVASGLIVAVLVIALLTSWRTGAWRLALIAAAAAIPPAIAILAVDTRSSAFGDVRLRVEGVAFGAAARDPARLGGSAALDDILVEGLPPRTAEIRPDGNLTAFPTAAPGPRLPEGPLPAEAAVVSVAAGAGEAESFLGVHPVGPSDRFCIVDCADAGATWYRVDEDLTGLVVDGGGPPLPDFRRRPLRRWLGDFLSDTIAFYAPGQLIYPMRDYGREWKGSADSLLNPCAQRFVCDARRMPVRSFLFRDRSRSLHLALLDDGAVLETRGADGATRRLSASQPPRVALGGRPAPAQVTLWQVVYGGAETDIASGDRASRLVRRRVMNVAGSPRGLDVGFRVQPTAVIELADVSEAARRIERGGLDAPVAVALTGAQADRGSVAPGNLLHLDGIGGGLAAAISPGRGNIASLIFPQRFADADPLQRTLPDLGGAMSQADGETRRFTIGTAGSDGRRILLSVDRFSYPKGLRTVILAWAILFAFLQAALWRENRPALILVLGLQLLLLLRIFVAVGSAGLDPQIAYRAVAGDALIAYCAVPFAMALLFPSRTPPAWAYGAPGAFLILLAVSLYRDGAASREMLLAALALGAVGILRPLLPRVLRRLPDVAGSKRIARWRRRARVGLRRGGYRLWVGAALAIFVVRLGLALGMNANERIFGVALSAVFLPLSLVVMAGMLESWRRAPARRAGAGARSAAFVAVLLFLAVPFVTNDIGFFFIHAPPVAVVAGTMVRPDWSRWTKAAAVAPAAAALLFLAGSIGTAMLPAGRAAPTTAAADPAPAPEASALLARLAQANQERDDNWRIKAVFDPGTLNEAGTGPAEQIRRWRFLLANFTASSDGRGFPYRAELSDLRRVQADDNVSAIHLMAPFGRSAAASLILMLGMVAWAAGRTSPAGPGIARTTARLALWTIFAAAAYMILANLILVPFTGRNVYLLAALSRSDLLEGAILFGLCFAGLVAAAGRRRGTA